MVKMMAIITKKNQQESKEAASRKGKTEETQPRKIRQHPK